MNNFRYLQWCINDVNTKKNERLKYRLIGETLFAFIHDIYFVQDKRDDLINSEYEVLF